MLTFTIFQGGINVITGHMNYRRQKSDAEASVFSSSELVFKEDYPP